MKHTKIVATVSDKRCDTPFIKLLVDAGMNVVRMNSAHLEFDGFRKIVENTRKADETIAIMMDTKGPEIRTTATATGEPVEFHTGETVIFKGNPNELTTENTICLNFAEIAEYVSPGNRFLIDDGELAFRITDVQDGMIYAKAENDGVLGARKSVNIPGVAVPLPGVTERDKRNIGYGVTLGVDFIAHSFVRSAADVREVEEVIHSFGGKMKIISKIENQEGIDNFDEILDASYGIMIARGDLGIEVAAERIPAIQMMMVNKCIAAHKPVIVATQMLHTMIEHPRPTRAEVSDVANAVFQHADAMMLSGETAYGKYPVEAVRTMARVATEVEASQVTRREIPEMTDSSVTSFLSRQAVLSESKVGTKAIITDTYHGLTARFISSFRGINPTIAICYNREVQRWLSLSYGVLTYYFERKSEKRGEKHPSEAIKKMIEGGLLNPHDRVAYLAGSEIGATSLEINLIKDLI